VILRGLADTFSDHDEASAADLVAGLRRATDAAYQAVLRPVEGTILTVVRAATEVPVLRKDFVTDPYEVAEARACGADAVLLIVAALEPSQLRDLVALTKSRGLAALVEVHDEAETHAALEADAHAIGVNHRNLRDFSIDLGLTERLRKLVPENVVLVAESGIHTPADARRLREAGADAILVGEALMRSADPAAQISELLG